MGSTGSLANAAFNVSAAASLTVNGALSGAPVISNSGYIAFNNANQTIASLSGGGLTFLNGTTLTTGAITTSGTLNGTGALVYSLNGATTTLNPAGTLLYSGSTTINGPGTFQAFADANFSSALPAAGVKLNNVNLEITAAGGGFATNRALTLVNSPTITVDAGASLGLQGPVSDGGVPQTIIQNGAGFLTLSSSANSFTSGTSFNISGGTLVAVGQQSPLGGPATGSLGSLPIALNGGSLVLTATSTAPVTFDVNQGNAITLTGGGGSILAGNPTVNGNTTGVNGGSITLVGSNGGLAVPSGATLNMGVLNGYTLAVGPSLQLSNSGTISVGPGGFSLQAGNVAYSGGTFSASNGGTLTMLGAVGSGTYSPTTGGTVIMSGTYSGLLSNLSAASGATLLIVNNVSSGTLNVAGGAVFPPARHPSGPRPCRSMAARSPRSRP